MDVNSLIFDTLRQLDSDVMLYVLYVGAAIGLLILLALIIPKRQAKYKAREYLFTKPEWRFASALQSAVQHDWLMMGKVRIADLLAVESDPKLDRGDWMRAFSRISQKHIDYVLVDPGSGRVECCIELDDASHNRKDRIERDVFVNAAFDQADLPLLRIPTESHYDPHMLREQIKDAVKGRSKRASKKKK